MPGENIYASVYGCPSNIADYEISMGLLKDEGFNLVETPEKADLIIIFTCIVKTPTETRMIRLIQDLVKMDKPMIVAGCMPKTSQRTLERIAPETSILGPDSINHIVEAVESTLKGVKVMYLKDERKSKLGMPRVRKNGGVGVVPISIGCLSRCSYCAVKFARGKLYSYPIEDIVRDVDKALEDGCSKIWLTSQDNGSYGKDRGKNLVELLERVCDIDGDFQVRVGMVNPTHLRDNELLQGLIESYRDKKIKKFLHLPVQSGSDRILKKMKRGYTVEDFEDIVENFREEFPDIFISTDIIVGFPGETEEDFQKTISLVKRLKPENVNISKFGARPGTKAAKMEQLDVKTINERSRRLHSLISSF